MLNKRHPWNLRLKPVIRRDVNIRGARINQFEPSLHWDDAH